MDLEFFVAQWGLDTSAQTALLQLEPEVQARVVQDFAPKPGTRDVNKLFHGFIRSLVTSSSALQRSAEAANAEVLAAHQAMLSHSSTAPARGFEGADAASTAFLADLPSFLAQWGLDASAYAMLLEQPPDVQARVILEFQPKPGTRDVNRLFHGFLRSIRTTGHGQPHAAAQASSAAQAQAQAFVAAAAHAAPRGGAFGAEARGGRAPRWSAGTAAAHGPAFGQGTLQAFVGQWGLDEAAQRALLQLDPAMQGKVITDFAPKPGTRDVNRLFHGFLRSVQTSPRMQAELLGAAGADPLAAQLGLYGDAGAGFAAGEAYAGGGDELRASMLASLYQADLGADPVQLQTFVQTWGLDESSQAMLLQMDPLVQAQVLQDFAPKPHTQDINRLFHGFVRSVGSRTTAGGASPLSSAAMQQAVSIGAAITESLAAQGGFVPSAGATAKRGAGGTWGAEAHGAHVEAPSPDEIAGFLQAWGLDSACAVAVEGLSPEVQWRVLDQFRPRPGTRDVRSLFYGFIKSVAFGGGKRLRADLQPQYHAEELISA